MLGNFAGNLRTGRCPNSLCRQSSSPSGSPLLQYLTRFPRGMKEAPKINSEIINRIGFHNIQAYRISRNQPDPYFHRFKHAREAHRLMLTDLKYGVNSEQNRDQFKSAHHVRIECLNKNSLKRPFPPLSHRFSPRPVARPVFYFIYSSNDEISSNYLPHFF